MGGAVLNVVVVQPIRPTHPIRRKKRVRTQPGKLARLHGRPPASKLWQLAVSRGGAFLRASFSLNYSSPELAAELLQGSDLLQLEGGERETSRERERESSEDAFAFRTALLGLSICRAGAVPSVALAAGPHDPDLVRVVRCVGTDTGLNVLMEQRLSLESERHSEELTHC